MENHLGFIGGKPSKFKSLVLRQNRIKSRHYAIDPEGKITHTVSQLGANAVKDALKKWEGNLEKLNLLVAATSQGDSLVPGIASSLQSDLKMHPCEISSIHGVCSSGMMALRQAQVSILSGVHQNAIACATEFASRFFRPAFLDVIGTIMQEERTDSDIEFLRWMLSDGAGATILENKPNERGLSLKVDWIDIASYASQYPTCMYAGARKDGDMKELSRFWYQYPTVDEAVRDGALTLRQDMTLLDNIVKLGVRRYFELIDKRMIDPSGVDWMVCHYSSHHFFEEIQSLLKDTGGYIPAEKWFTNLYSVGNIGSASLFVNLNDLFYSGKLKAGDRILCMIPESARFIVSFAQFTVVDAPNKKPNEISLSEKESIQSSIKTENDSKTREEIKSDTLRGLITVWGEFSSELRTVPFIDQMNRDALRIEDYKNLLLNMRQQVVEGSRWIARAASSMTSEYYSLRSTFIGHAKEEHKDYEMIERDFIALGGTLEEIQTKEKNVGSEALAAWMFHQSSQINPFDLLGAMFIIEGLGKTFASEWAEKIKKQLNLNDNQVSFLKYHGVNDENHMKNFEQALDVIPLDQNLSKRMIKTARVTAELYCLQLRRLERY